MRDFVIPPIIIDSPKRNHSNTYGRLLTSVNSVCLLLLSSTHGVKPGQLAALPGDCDITSDSGVWRVFSTVSQSVVPWSLYAHYLSCRYWRYLWLGPHTRTFCRDDPSRLFRTGPSTPARSPTSSPTRAPSTSTTPWPCNNSIRSPTTTHSSRSTLTWVYVLGFFLIRLNMKVLWAKLRLSDN